MSAPQAGDHGSHLAGLLRPDGSVIVPSTVAGEVLRLLVLAMNEQARSTGGVPTATARWLLHALYEAARLHTAADIAPPAAAEVSHTLLTVREVAARKECSPRWVRYLLASGRLAGRRTGRDWLVEPAALLPHTEVPSASA